jgi:hypothetical protein
MSLFLCSSVIALAAPPRFRPAKRIEFNGAQSAVRSKDKRAHTSNTRNQRSGHNIMILLTHLNGSQHTKFLTCHVPIIFIMTAQNAIKTTNAPVDPRSATTINTHNIP